MSETMRALGMPELRSQVLECLRPDSFMSLTEVVDHVGCSSNGAQKHLDVLLNVGAIRAEFRRIDGSDRPARCYSLDSAGLEELAWRVFDELTARADRL